MGTLLASATIPDGLTFAVAAVIAVGGALGVVLNRNAVHAALMLMMTLFGVAVLFVEENAQFLAAVQIIVYAGAIVVLFLFVIMLLGAGRAEAVFSDSFKRQRAAAILLGALVLVEVLLFGTSHWVTGAHTVTGAVNNSTPNVTTIARALFTTYLLPFEVTSALLVVAVIGAVVLTRRADRGHQAVLDSELIEPEPPTEPPAPSEAPSEEPSTPEEVGSR